MELDTQKIAPWKIAPQKIAPYPNPNPNPGMSLLGGAILRWGRGQFSGHDETDS